MSLLQPPGHCSQQRVRSSRLSQPLGLDKAWILGVARLAGPVVFERSSHLLNILNMRALILGCLLVLVAAQTTNEPVDRDDELYEGLWFGLGYGTFIVIATVALSIVICFFSAICPRPE